MSETRQEIRCEAARGGGQCRAIAVCVVTTVRDGQICVCRACGDRIGRSPGCVRYVVSWAGDEDRPLEA